MAFARIGQKEIVILFTAFIAAAYGFGIYLFPAIVEAIRQDIQFSYAEMGLISGAVQSGFLLSAAMAGFLTLRFGAINLILFSIITCAACLGGLALIGNVYAMGSLLLILGACASLIWVPMVEVSREIIAPRNRGKALGLMSSGTSYGVFANGALLAVVLPAFGWRAIWGVTCFIAIALALYCAWRMGTSRLSESRPGAARNGHPREDDAVPVERLGVRARLKSLPKPLVGAILAMMFVNGFSCMPFQTYLSAHLIGEVGLEGTRVASVWSLIGLMGMFSGFLMGALADRITIRRGMIVVYLVLCAAVMAMIFAGDSGMRLALVYVASIAFGISFYAIFGLAPAYISHLFGEGNAALVFAFGNVALGMGGVVGNVVGGYVKDLLGSFGALHLMILAAAIMSVAIACFLPSEVRVEAQGFRSRRRC